MSIIEKIKSIFVKEEEGDKHYLTQKEIKNISKANNIIIKELEAKKKATMQESEYLAEMSQEDTILELDNLHSYFFTDQGTVKAVNGVSFNVPQGATVGIVGESGCGKSVTSMSIMRLLQGPQGQIVEGSIKFKSRDFKRDDKGEAIPIYEIDAQGNIVTEPVKATKGQDKLDQDGNIVTEIVRDKKGNPKLDKEGNVVTRPVRYKVDKDGNIVMRPVVAKDKYGARMYEMEEKVFDIAKMPIKELHRLRGREMAMIFQEPMTSLNPVFTIGNQLDEVTLLHVPGCTKEDAKARSIEMLNLVGIAMPERVYGSYPFELSGGMRQRVMISMALACNPRLIIADEPTTALDVTIQAQILDLLRDIKHRINGSILLITHDLGIIAEMADYIVVMYAGRIIEQGTVDEIFHNPMHPYTIGLQKSKPSIDKETEYLFNIPGNVPNPINMPNTCFFKERCDKCIKKCNGEYPEMIKVSDTHYVACHLYGKEGADGK